MSELLRVADVAKITGLAERTLRRLIAQKRLQVIRPAGLRVVLVPQETVVSLLASTLATTAPAQQGSARRASCVDDEVSS